MFAAFSKMPLDFVKIEEGMAVVMVSLLRSLRCVSVIVKM